MDFSLQCASCGHEEPKDKFRCSKCNSILEVNYDYSKLRIKSSFKNLPIKHAKYRDFFPIDKDIFTLGEGGTDLRSVDFFHKKVLLKFETQNPTKSFKDRGSSIEITKALEFGFKEVCCASTGNMGISLSRYAKEAGLKCTIVISKDAYPEKIKKIEQNGADIKEITGDFNDALSEAEKFVKKTGAFLCGDYHYRKEGQKSVMFEILEQLDYKPPDLLFVPVGNATLLAATYKAIDEFDRFFRLHHKVRIIAVQAENCSPFVDACMNDSTIKRVKPNTIADAIAVGYPTFGFEGLRAIKDTGGLCMSVNDKEIVDAVQNLKRLGINAEPGGAAAFAGFTKLNNETAKMLAGKTAVVMVTGNNEHSIK